MAAAARSGWPQRPGRDGRNGQVGVLSTMGPIGPATGPATSRRFRLGQIQPMVATPPFMPRRLFNLYANGRKGYKSGSLPAGVVCFDMTFLLAATGTFKKIATIVYENLTDKLISVRIFILLLMVVG